MSYRLLNYKFQYHINYSFCQSISASSELFPAFFVYRAMIYLEFETKNLNMLDRLNYKEYGRLL